MQLAKPRFDIGLNTNSLAPMLEFWQKEAGATFDHVLRIAPGIKQHRHALRGSVLKINHYREPLPDRIQSGYRELIVAQTGLDTARTLRDPDGNLVTLVPHGTFGIEQLAMKLAVRDLQAHHRFYTDAMGLEHTSYPAGTGFRAGESLVLCETSADAQCDAGFEGKGWRYLTFQVFKTDQEHARIVARGGREEMAPRTLGTTARISMVSDPDGNWIEISQRASIVGSLDP